MDAAYSPYDEDPIDEPDEWGDLAMFRTAAGSSNLDSVESVSIGVLVERLDRLSDERMRAICAALSVAVDCS